VFAAQQVNRAHRVIAQPVPKVLSARQARQVHKDLEVKQGRAARRSSDRPVQPGTQDSQALAAAEAKPVSGVTRRPVQQASPEHQA
jgi:hypothetical protein